MTISMQYDNHQENLIVKANGKISISDIKSCIFNVLNSAEYPQDVNTLWDVRELSFEHIDIEFLKQFVALRREYNAARGNAKIAIVSNYALAAPIIKLYLILSAGLKQKNKVFWSPDEAQQWLCEDLNTSSNRILN